MPIRALNRLLVALDIRADEGQLVGLVLLYGCALEFARALTGTISSTLFLTAFSAESLAYIYLGSAVTIPVTGLLYLHLQARLALPRLIAVTLGALALSLVLVRVALLLAPAPWLAVALMIWFTVLYVLVQLAFWGLNGRLFNVRQGKRLFGLLNAGMESGQVVGGLLIPLLVLAVGPTNLLLIAAGGLCVALVMETIITRRRPDPPAAEVQADTRTEHVQAEPQSLYKRRSVRLICGLVICSFMAYLYLDTIFFALAQTHYPSAEQLANLIGITLGITSVLTIASQVLLSAPFMRRYGVKAGLLVLPTLVIGGTLLMVSVGTVFGPVLLVFWITMLTRITERALRFSIDETSLQIMYQPLPVAQRSMVQTVVEGGMKPLAGGLAGAGILVFTHLLGFGGVQLGYVLLALAIVWLGVAYLLGREYPAMLRGALHNRHLMGTSLTLNDRASLVIFEQRLSSPHAGEVIYALYVLEEAQHEQLPRMLETALAHLDADVRREALLRIERLHLSEVLPGVRQRLTIETDPAMIGALLRTIGALADDDVFDQLSPYLEHDEPLIRLGALLGLVHNGGIEGMVVVSEWLVDQVRSPDAARRSFAAQLIGEAGITSLYRPLTTLLRDDAVVVRRAAVIAAGALKQPRLWPLVIEQLSVPAVRSDAASALVAGGDAAIPDLRIAFTAEHAPALQAAIIRVVGRIGGSRALAFLLGLPETPDESLRRQVLVALDRCRYRARTEAEIARVHEHLRWESARAAWVLAVLHDLGEHSALAPLRDALDNTLKRGRERIFVLLSFLYDRETIRRVHTGLDSAAGEQRAYGLELLDVMLPQPIKAILLPLLDDLPAVVQRTRLQPLFPHPQRGRMERLQELITENTHTGNSWITACAMYARHHLHGLDRHIPTEGEQQMLQLIEKVIMLKAVRIFAGIPDDILADVAARLGEVALPAGTTLFEKGAPGDCVYIIERGQVRVHDGERIVNHLGPRAVFGEMAVLNAAPRLASVTAVADTTLFRLDQETLFDLMADHVVIMREIVRTLSEYLQNSFQNLSELDARERAMSAPESDSATLGSAKPLHYAG